MTPNGPQQQISSTSNARGANRLPENDADWKRDLESNGSENVTGGDNALRGLLSSEYETAQNAIRYFSLDWDEFEDLLFVQGRSPDNSRIRVSEGSLSTIVIERAGRVMSNSPTGVVRSLGIQNQGKGLLMNLVLDKHIYPNANYQYDMDTKLFLWDMYSNVYGAMAMCYDWTVTDNYVGPDCWLIPMRNFFPQQGRLSVRNCDFVFVSNFVSRDFLQELVDDEIDGYDLDAIQMILDQTAHGATMPKARQDYLRTNPMWETRRRAPFTDTNEIEVVTKYEAGKDGRWLDFCPDFDNVVIRNIPNPHKSGRIPVVLKPGLPTLDSIIGRGDMEAGRYQQYAMDTTLNLQIDRLRLATYPPIKVVNGNVVMPSIRFQPGAKWLVSNPNDVTHHQFPDVQENMNLTYQFLKGAMNNTLGNTTTQVSTEANGPVQGKTPQAIKAQNSSQSTRDAIDTKLMGKAIEELFGGMINLINDVDHPQPIEFYQFGQEIAQIAQNYPDIKDCVRFEGQTKGADISTAKAVKITIKPSRIKNEKGYLYQIDPMSTQRQDQEAEHAQLIEIWNELLPNYQAISGLLQQSNMTFDFATFFKHLLQTGGVRNIGDIIKPVSMGMNQGAAPQSQQTQGQQGQAPENRMTEQINIKDLPPAGAVQLAAQAGIQLTPQDFEQQSQQEAATKLDAQKQLKGIPSAPSTQPVVQAQPPMPTSIPEIAQARAQIAATHAGIHKKLSDDIAAGRM
jgi:hypothetical protein